VTVEDGWTCHFTAQAGGGIQILDAQGRRVKMLPGFGQCALAAITEGPNGSDGDWVDAYALPNIQVEETSFTNLLAASLSSNATPDVRNANELEIQSTVAITDLLNGIQGQRITLTLTGGTNTTMCLITHSASLALMGGRNWQMSTGESLELVRNSSEGWVETGRCTKDSFAQNPFSSAGTLELVCSESSEVDADSYNFFNISCCASFVGTSGIKGGEYGQIITFHTTLNTAGIHHSTAVGYIDLAKTQGLATTAAWGNHGTSYGPNTEWVGQFQLDADGVWHPIGDCQWPASG
jgi:hypothetical protein